MLTNFYSSFHISLSVDEYQSAANLSLTVAIIFFLFFLLGLFFFHLTKVKRTISTHKMSSIKVLLHNEVIVPSFGETRYFYILKKHRIYFWSSIILIGCVWFVFFSGGYKKIMAFGQDYSMLEYRLLGGFEDEKIFLAIIQIARRLLLPFFVIYFMLFKKYSSMYSKKFIWVLNISLFVSIIITLDRGPLMLMLVMFYYYAYCTSKNISKLFIITTATMIGIILSAGFVTFIQYNKSDFGFNDIIVNGLAFILQRAYLAPSFLPIELSYGLFDFDTPKLFLQHSRLFALLGAEYVTTLAENAVYVGPVGAVADIWRNIGMVGIISIGFILGVYFALIDYLQEKVDPITSVCISFTAITLVFYFLYGTFFSQGVFLQILFLYIISKYSSSDGRMWNLIINQRVKDIG